MNMICSLDYLIGTLATAYKGVITTLVAKDFCICEADGTSVFKGTLLSMPAGNYYASLIKNGVELDRAPIHMLSKTLLCLSFRLVRNLSCFLGRIPDALRLRE